MEPDERYIESIRLQNKQRYVNKMFEEEGLTDEILDKQIEINKRRNELDLPDREEFIYEDENGKEWVQ